jgi:hypothetical protein
MQKKMKVDQRRSLSDWSPITVQELEKILHKESYEDIQSLTKYCERIGRTWTIDVLKQSHCYLIMVGVEDASWIYEFDKIDDQYFRQIYLSREDLHFFVRRMNEKRKFRRV